MLSYSLFLAGTGKYVLRGYRHGGSDGQGKMTTMRTDNQWHRPLKEGIARGLTSVMMRAVALGILFLLGHFGRFQNIP